MSMLESNLFGNNDNRLNNMNDLPDDLMNVNLQDDMATIDQEDGMVLSDQKEALKILANDKGFLKELISKKNVKDMQNLFSKRGVILSFEQIDLFIEMVRHSALKEELPDDFFENAAAGDGVLNNEGAHNLIGSITNLVNEIPESPEVRESIFWA